MSSLAKHPRIVIVGTSCSGKSTLARRLAARLGRPFIELDALYWGPDWTPHADFRERVTRAVEADAWIVAGNYSVVRDLVWTRATAIVWLNLPFPLVLVRALRRTVGRIITGEELYNGNRESFQSAFLRRDSILLWVITTYHRNKRRFRRELTAENLPGMAIFELRSQAEVEAFGR
jgi:adenylate kinase family enzyme